MKNLIFNFVLTIAFAVFSSNQTFAQDLVPQINQEEVSSATGDIKTKKSCCKKGKKECVKKEVKNELSNVKKACCKKTGKVCSKKVSETTAVAKKTCCQKGEGEMKCEGKVFSKVENKKVCASGCKKACCA